MPLGQIVTRTKLAAVALLASLALAACGQGGTSRTSAGTGSTQTAPLATRIVPAAALEARLSAHQPVVLLFMATGCASCAAQVGTLQQAMRSHPGVQAFGIDISSADTPHDLQSFLEGQNLTDAPFLWVIDRDGSLVSRYHTAELDATVGIDRLGVIRFQNPGPSGAAQLARQLAALLNA